MESLSRKDLIVTRPYSAGDRNFILATFLRGLYYGDSWFSEVPKDVFMREYHKALEALLTRPGVNIKIAALKEDSDVILGYSITRQVKNGEGETSVLDFIFVKSAWRKIGIGKMLLPQRLHAVTHLTKSGLNIMRKKLPDVVFNPWLY